MENMLVKQKPYTCVILISVIAFVLHYWASDRRLDWKGTTPAISKGF